MYNSFIPQCFAVANAASGAPFNIVFYREANGICDEEMNSANAAQLPALNACYQTLLAGQLLPQLCDKLKTDRLVCDALERQIFSIGIVFAIVLFVVVLLVSQFQDVVDLYHMEHEAKLPKWQLTRWHKLATGIVLLAGLVFTVCAIGMLTGSDCTAADKHVKTFIALLVMHVLAVLLLLLSPLITQCVWKRLDNKLRDVENTASQRAAVG